MSTAKTRDIAGAIQQASGRRKPTSQSQADWDRLDAGEQESVLAALRSGSVGPGKMRDLLHENGLRISAYFLINASKAVL